MLEHILGHATKFQKNVANFFAHIHLLARIKEKSGVVPKSSKIVKSSFVFNDK